MRCSAGRYGFERGNGGEESGGSAGDDFGLKQKFFRPRLETVFFDFHLVFTRGEVGCRIGGGEQLAVDVDLGAVRGGSGDQQTGGLDGFVG